MSILEAISPTARLLLGKMGGGQIENRNAGAGVPREVGQPQQTATRSRGGRKPSAGVLGAGAQVQTHHRMAARSRTGQLQGLRKNPPA